MKRLIVSLLFIVIAGCGRSSEDMSSPQRDSSEPGQTLDTPPSPRGRHDKVRRPITKTKLAAKYLDEGAARFKEYKYRQALDAFIKALEVEPKNPLLWEALGDLCLVQGAFVKAEQSYEQAYKLDRKNPYWRFKLGNVHMKMGKQKEAEKELKWFIGRSSDTESAYLSLSDLYIQQHDYGRAEPILQEAVQKHPRNPEAHFLLGKVYEWRKMDKKALREYYKAYGLDPKNVMFVYMLATTLERLGMHDDAKQYFQIHKKLYGKQIKDWREDIKKKLDSKTKDG